MDIVHFSSKSNEWETPSHVFDYYNRVYRFELDVAATDENHLCENYFTKETNALVSNFHTYKNVWMNPPYGRDMSKFIKKAYDEYNKTDSNIQNMVWLIPARTDTKAWHEYVMKSSEIHFIRGRLKFVNKTLDDISPNSAPFPSCIVVFQRLYKDQRQSPIIKSISFDK